MTGAHIKLNGEFLIWRSIPKSTNCQIKNLAKISCYAVLVYLKNPYSYIVAHKILEIRPKLGGMIKTYWELLLQLNLPNLSSLFSTFPEVPV